MFAHGAQSILFVSEIGYYPLFLAAYGDESLLTSVLQLDQCLKLWWNRHMNL